MKEQSVKLMLMIGICIVGFILIPNNEASAASSNGYDYTSGECTVQVYSDYYNYTSTASTVNGWATNSGCETLYYTLDIVDQWGHTVTTQEFSGYFSSRTPTKYFDIDLIDDYNAPNGVDSDAYTVEIDLYADSAHSIYLGKASTNILIDK